MGTATTFAELQDNPASHKIFLAELNLAEELADWSLTAGKTFTYEISYLNETVTLASETPGGSDRTETIRKEISSLEEDGTALTEKTSIATVEANTGSWWHDTTNGKLYVHTSGDDAPTGYTIIGYFWLYFATEPVELNSRHYEGYLGKDGIPTLTQRNANIHWGISQISSGELRFLAARGYFDQICRSFIWANKTVRLLLGGDDLAYSEYQTLFTAIIIDKEFTADRLTLRIKSKAFRLLSTIPTDTFNTTDWPNLDPAKDGHPVPTYYGVYDQYQAPEVTCVNTAYGATTYQFKICSHAIGAITQVYVDYMGGSGWQTKAHANEDLAAATFTITSASYVPGTSRVKVAFTGKQSGGSTLENGPHIVEDMLTTLCGLASSDLDTTAFDNSKTISEAVLNVPIETQQDALAVIEGICLSDLAFFDENGDGELRYRTWEPTRSTSEDEIDTLDILAEPRPRISDDSSWLYWKVHVGYGYYCWDKTFKYANASEAASKYKYGHENELTIDTYIRGSDDAGTLAERLLRLFKDPSPLLTMDAKMIFIDKLLGDKIEVTMARAPYEESGGYDERVFEIFGLELSAFPQRHTIEARDLLEYGKNQGFWMASTASAWGDCTTQQKQNSGFWCDSNGYALTADKGSKDASLWW